MDCGLFHLMEDFILKEVDYSQQYGYSSRAKRHMRRKLNKELAPYINDSDHSDEECESIILAQNKYLNICFPLAYIFIIGTVYTTTIYIVHMYSKSCP